MGGKPFQGLWCHSAHWQEVLSDFPHPFPQVTNAYPERPTSCILYLEGAFGSSCFQFLLQLESIISLEPMSYISITWPCQPSPPSAHLLSSFSLLWIATSSNLTWLHMHEAVSLQLHAPASVYSLLSSFSQALHSVAATSELCQPNPSRGNICWWHPLITELQIFLQPALAIFKLLKASLGYHLVQSCGKHLFRILIISQLFLWQTLIFPHLQRLVLIICFFVVDLLLMSDPFGISLP